MTRTTSGGLRPEWTLDLSDPERLWWLERCVRHNEKLEEEMDRARQGR